MPMADLGAVVPSRQGRSSFLEPGGVCFRLVMFPYEEIRFLLFVIIVIYIMSKQGTFRPWVFTRGAPYSFSI